MLLAASILLVTVADIGFGYSEVLGKTVEQGRVGIWDAIYSDRVNCHGCIYVLAISDFIDPKSTTCENIKVTDTDVIKFVLDRIIDW